MAAADAAKDVANKAGSTAMNAGGWLVRQFTTHLPRTVFIGVCLFGGAHVLGLMAPTPGVAGAAVVPGKAFLPAVGETAKAGLTAAWEGGKTLAVKGYEVASHVDWTAVGDSLTKAGTAVANPVPTPAG